MPHTWVAHSHRCVRTPHVDRQNNQYDQSTLLEEMVANGMEAVLVKVASQGLLPHKHLGKSIAELAPVFQACI